MGGKDAAPLSRRSVLGGMAAATIAVPAVARAAQAVAGDQSLGAIAASRGIRFGSATTSGIPPMRFAGQDRKPNTGLQDPKLVELLLREARILVPTNDLKQYTIQPTGPATYNFQQADAMVAFCKQHRLPLRGHTLLWAKDEFLPQWLLGYDFGPNPKVAAEKMLRDYITTVAGRYKDDLVSWDVVNEAIDEKTGEIRGNVFTRILGRDTLRICFEAARDVLPRMELVYNDYMDWGPKDAVHRKAAIDLLRWFRDAKVPVDTLGLQAHISADDDPTGDWDRDLRRFLDEAVAMDYKLLVSEFDVHDKTIMGSIAHRDAVVARTAERFLDPMLSYRQMRDFLCWGLDDKYSWLQNTSARPDKLPKRATPYDEQFRPKPLRAAMAKAFAAAPAR